MSAKCFIKKNRRLLIDIEKTPFKTTKNLAYLLPASVAAIFVDLERGVRSRVDWVLPDRPLLVVSAYQPSLDQLE